VRRFFGLDADALTGEVNHLQTSATYFLEKMGGHLSAWSAQAAMSSTMSVVFGSWHYPGQEDAGEEDDRTAGNSVMIFNKLYGVTVDVPVRKSDVREQMHIFSAFFPRLRRERLDAREWLHEPLYGGLTDRGENEEPRYVPRPAVMDRMTQNLMFEGSSDFGWRALFYENQGHGDPYPTGIVALEGFLFKRVPHTYTSDKGKQIDGFRPVDETDLVAYAERVERMISESNRLVEQREHTMASPIDKPSAQAPVVPDAVREQMQANARTDGDTTATTTGGGLADVMSLD